MTGLLAPAGDVVAGEPAASGPRTGRSRRERLLEELRRPESIVTLLIVVACTVFVFVQLQPSQLFRDTTPSGGDLGAHVWLPAYIKRVLLPRFQLFGWTMDWYAGFPALTFYFPLPMVAIAVVSYVIPYDIAFKLVTVAGILTLPLACAALGRLARMPFPGPACLAIASVPYLFGREFTIYGGNIASTMAGEFCFSISLSFAMLFLGLMARVLRTGRGRVAAAVVLALCGLSHILPLFFAVVGAVVQLLMGFDRRRLRLTVTVLVVAGLLLAFWALPYEYRLPYATNMGYQKITTYLDTLFPAGDLWLYLLAGAGSALALARRERTGTFLSVMAVLAALAFRVSPNARLWNARWLPFWFLCLYLLAGVAFAQVGAVLVERWQSRHGLGAPGLPDARSLLSVPVVTLLVALIWTGYPLRILPLGHVTATGDYDWLGITSSDDSYVPDWITWDMSGYQAADKSGRTAYFALIDEMKKLGATDGCGRAMYEYEPAINDMGTTDALMLLPYWTDGCIASMEGLYYESSATTPYHFINASELSEQPADPMRGITYAPSPDVAEGVEHLQMFGVKYFLAVSREVQAQAAVDPSLKLLAKVGPYPTDVTSTSGQTTIVQQTWRIYEVLDSPLVEPLANQPVVMTGVVGGSDEPWLEATEAWYLDPNRWDVYETASGPASWARVAASDTDPPVQPEPSVTVSHVHLGEESVSFDVSRPGVPVLVKVSYFPNWQVRGASGVYRATPNLMIVVPTSTHVVLTYGYTPIDWLGLALSLVGLLALLCLWRRPTLAWLPPAWSGRGRRDHAPGGRPGDADAEPFWAGPDQGTAAGQPWYVGEPRVGPLGDEPEPTPTDPGPGRPDGVASHAADAAPSYPAADPPPPAAPPVRFELPAPPPPEDDDDPLT